MKFSLELVEKKNGRGQWNDIIGVCEARGTVPAKVFKLIKGLNK